jgi:hypothetical protein
MNYKRGPPAIRSAYPQTIDDLTVLAEPNFTAFERDPAYLRRSGLHLKLGGAPFDSSGAFANAVYYRRSNRCGFVWYSDQANIIENSGTSGAAFGQAIARGVRTLLVDLQAIEISLRIVPASPENTTK